MTAQTRAGVTIPETFEQTCQERAAQPPTHVLLDDRHRAHGRAQHDRRHGRFHARRGYHDRCRGLDHPEASPSTAVTGRRRRIAD
jgi:hypothetical protein